MPKPKTAGILTARQRKVWSVIATRTSREEAIKAPEIAKLCGIEEREVRGVVHDLRLLEYPVASLVDPPHGYFRAVKPSDLDETLRHMAARVDEIERPAMRLRRVQIRLASGSWMEPTA